MMKMGITLLVCVAVSVATGVFAVFISEGNIPSYGTTERHVEGNLSVSGTTAITNATMSSATATDSFATTIRGTTASFTSITTGSCDGCGGGGGSYTGSTFVASTTISLDLGTVALSNCNDTNITVTGTALGDFVITSLPAQPTGVSASAYPSADTVTIRRCNSRSGTSADPATASYGIEVRR